jgi:hypothetical protein
VCSLNEKDCGLEKAFYYYRALILQVAYTTVTVKKCNSEQETSALCFMNTIKQQTDKRSLDVKIRGSNKFSNSYLAS